MENINANDTFGWDDDGYVVSSEYQTLTPGVALFSVTGFERGYFEGSDKMAAGPQAIISMELTNGREKTFYTEKLTLNKKMMRKITSFFKAIGLVDPKLPDSQPYPLGALWGKVIGCVGYCEVGNREYNGQTYNNIKKFIYSPTKDEEAKIAAVIAATNQTQAPTAPAAQQPSWGNGGF